MDEVERLFMERYRILRIDQIEKLVGSKRSTIYQWMGEGLFPRPIKIGRRRVGWLLKDYKAWLEQKRKVRYVMAGRYIASVKARRIEEDMRSYMLENEGLF